MSCWYNGVGESSVSKLSVGGMGATCLVELLTK